MKADPVFLDVCKISDLYELDELLANHETVQPRPYLRLVYERNQRIFEDALVPWDAQMVEGLIY